MDAPTQAILSAFSIVLGHGIGDRQAAEQSLTALEVLEDYPIKVANIFLNDQLCVELRQLAGITLKNYIAVHWSETSCMSFKPPETCDNAKSLIRSGMLQLLTSPHRSIRVTAAHTITLIAQHDWPEMWPDLFNQLITLIRQSCMNNNNDINKNTVHGVLRVLTEVSSDLSDLDLPVVGPFIMPELLRIYSDKQTYDQSTRRRAVITIDNLLNIAVMCQNEDILNDFVNRYICPSLGAIISDLTTYDENSTISQVSHKGELIQLLITLCVENRKFFSNFPGYNISQMINIVLNLVISCVKQYTELQIASNSSNEKEEEYDSDGEILDYDTFVYSILQCLTSLISSKSRKSMIKYLDELCSQLCQLVQLPEKTLETWSNSIAEYVVDSEEFLGYSVRLVTMDLIKKIASKVHNGAQFINCAINKMLILSESLHNEGVVYWWKLLEACLYISGNLASNSINIFSHNNRSIHQTLNNTSNSCFIEFDVFYTHYLKPSLGQSDFPFLQATALRCMSHLYEANILNESQAQCFPSLLSNAMSATQSSILKISAMHSLDTLRANENNIKKPIETNTTTFVASSSVFITNYIVPHLPNLISNLLECLSTFGEPVLDVGLCGLYKLLCVDLNQFTQSIITQIIPIMVGLFKHCFGVATTLSYYTRIIRVLYKVASSNKESIEAIENALLPTLITYLENHEVSESGDIEAALKVFSVLISPSEFGISSNLIHRVFPAVVHIAITSTDAVVISECCDVIRCYLAAGSSQILEWHDDEGNNGVGYILHVTSRLLDPSNPVEWATPAGKLAYAILLHFDAQQLRENTDLLLRGVLARLCTLMGQQTKILIDVPIIVSMYKLLLNELDKKLEEEAECDDEGNDSEFDDNDDNSDDDNEEVQAEGFEQQEELYVEDEIKSDDKNDQDIVNQKKRKGKAKDNSNSDDMLQDDDDDADISNVDTEEDDIILSEDPIYSTDPIMNVNLKEFLCNFLSDLSHQIYYNEFSRYHTSLELTTLQRIGILPQNNE
ncbi:unnamed protein product [Schistosoma bovis]|nr:unnamed protein product [Schistosoma bovis]